MPLNTRLKYFLEVRCLSPQVSPALSVAEGSLEFLIIGWMMGIQQHIQSPKALGITFRASFVRARRVLPLSLTCPAQLLYSYTSSLASQNMFCVPRRVTSAPPRGPLASLFHSLTHCAGHASFLCWSNGWRWGRGTAARGQAPSLSPAPGVSLALYSLPVLSVSLGKEARIETPILGKSRLEFGGPHRTGVSPESLWWFSAHSTTEDGS